MVCSIACAISVSLYWPTSSAFSSPDLMTILFCCGVPDATIERLSVLNCCPALVRERFVMFTMPTRSSGLIDGRSATKWPLTLSVSVVKFKAFAFSVSICRSNCKGGYVDFRSAITSRFKEMFGS